MTLQAKMKGIGRKEIKPMAVRQRRYSKEELARRSNSHYGNLAGIRWNL